MAPSAATHSPRHALQPALTELGARHRSAVAAAIGASDDAPEAIGDALCDEGLLAAFVDRLDDDCRRLLTQTAFARCSAWSRGRLDIEEGTVQTLERHGLLLRFMTHWGATVVTPLELERPLQRVLVRARAAQAPTRDRPSDDAVLHVPEQLLHDAASLGALIAAGGVQIKADGDLFARATTRLLGALAPLTIELPELDQTRMGLALTLLEEMGALRVRSRSLPGVNARRELAVAADLASLLGGPPAARAALADTLDRADTPGRDMRELLLEAFAGATVALDDLGSALGAFFEEAGKQPPPPGFGVDDATFALYAILERWLRGEVGLALGSGGAPQAVVFAPGLAAEPSGAPCLAQGDFELVSMRPPSPGERAALLSVAEPVAGREHVMRITRARVHVAVRADIDVLDRLRSLAGTLPQNVEQTVRDWVRQSPRRARLRSAMMVAAPDSETGDRLELALGDALAERLSPTLLAVDGGELATVAHAVRAAGVELEDGLDRVSGTWVERPESAGLESWWRPTPPRSGTDAVSPPGRLTSGLSTSPAAVDGDDAGVDEHDDERRELSRILAEAGLPPEAVELLVDETLFDDDEDEELPGEALLEAYERECTVRLTYAGANGLRQEWGTITELDGARVQICEHSTGKRSWRWLRSISDVQIVD